MVTNVPYLTHTSMGSTLREYCATAYPEAKADLATVMQARCAKLVRQGGMLATVLPSTWMTYTKYFESFRVNQLESRRWDLVALLGKRAYETISGEVVDVCLHLSTSKTPTELDTVLVVDARDERTANDKAVAIIQSSLAMVAQLDSLSNPASAFDVSVGAGELLARLVTVYEGLSRGDTARFDRYFWELPRGSLGPWRRMVESPATTGLATGRSSVFLWQDGRGDLATHPSARVQGLEAWGRPGVIVPELI